MHGLKLRSVLYVYKSILSQNKPLESPCNLTIPISIILDRLSLLPLIQQLSDSPKLELVIGNSVCVLEGLLIQEMSSACLVVVVRVTLRIMHVQPLASKLGDAAWVLRDFVPVGMMKCLS